MARSVHIAFEPVIHELPVESILPLRRLAANVERSAKYARIASSFREVGIIEPLSVSKPNEAGLHLLLDGHLRYYVARAADQPTIGCIVEDEDEAFTYNKRVNRLATVQEHFMIKRAVERGASAEKIARALNVDVKLIQRRMALLDGVSPDVVELLKDRHVNPQTFELLRKMKPLRQYEAAELMVSAGNFTSSYAKAILAATRQGDLARPDRPKEIRGMSPEQMARMERELENLSRDFKSVESTFGDDVLHLVVASRYVSRLIANANVHAYLDKRHPEILAEFTTIVAATSLDQSP